MKIFSRNKNHDPLVKFVVAGTQKGGTTALDKYLREHVSIEMATKKEVHYFDNENHFNKGVDYSVYHSYFERNSLGKLLGEATPVYMYWYNSPKRIWQYNPDMKLIFVLRNPIDRAFSHWNMERDRNADSVSFWEAINSEDERCREALPLQHRVYSYTDRGYYSEQLRRIWHFFPKEQTLILKNEELRNSLKNSLDKVSSFLCIDDFKNIENKDIHSRPYISTMTYEERSYLKEIFYFEIKELENILGWDCSDWLD